MIKNTVFVVLVFLFFSCNNDKPNILLIIADDMSPLEDAITPSMDKLASKGIKFINAFSQYANCAPSRQSFITGLSPFRGLRQGRIDDYLKNNNHVSLPRFFKLNNYNTYSLGKVYHHSKDDMDSWDVFYDIPSIKNNYHNWESFASKKNQEITNNHLRPAIENVSLPLNKYNDYNIAREAIKLIKKSKSKPFFMTVGFRKPHLPFAAPRKFWELYDKTKFNDSEFKNATINGDSIVYLWSELSSYKPYTTTYKSENYRKKNIINSQELDLKHGYYACVSFIDYLIGMITDEVESLGIDNNTIIIITSDHGFHLGEQQIWGKHSNYKMSTNVPLIIYDPRMKIKNNISHGFVELLDLFPTLVDLTGLENNGKMDGKSIVPLINNPKAEGYLYAFSMYQSFQKDKSIKNLKAYALHNKKYTYIEWRDSINKKIVNQELYDIENGLETINIASDSSYKQIIKNFSKKIEIKNLSLL
jgi:arylsulfatase A-like enzyme